MHPKAYQQALYTYGLLGYEEAHDWEDIRLEVLAFHTAARRHSQSRTSVYSLYFDGNSLSTDCTFRYHIVNSYNAGHIQCAVSHIGCMIS